MAESNSAESPFIKLRLTAIDTVQLTPSKYPEWSEDSNVPYVFRRSPFFPASVELNRVPEIRIWGATEHGQRCCLHVHGALPYMYLDYKGSLNPEEVQDYIRRLARSLNHAMYLSLKSRNKGEYDPKKDQYVGFISLVKGIPFYGFHVGYRYFLKIYALQPQYSRRLFEILKGANILPRYKQLFDDESAKSMVHQVYEAHIPFLLQFMLDFNLYGCNWIELKKCMFRGELPDVDAEPLASGDSTISNPPLPVYAASNVPADMIFKPDRPHRVSPNSTLELDCHVSDILNRRYQSARNLHQDFTEFLHHPIPDSTKLVQSVKGVWEDEGARRRARGEEGPSEVSDVAPSGERRYPRGETPEWADSPKWRSILEKLLEDDRKKYMASHAGQWPPEFETFIKPPKMDEWIPTTFESIGSTFHETWLKEERASNPYGIWAAKGIGISVAPTAARGESEDQTGDLNWLADLRNRGASLDPLEGGMGFNENSDEEDQQPRRIAARQRQQGNSSESEDNDFGDADQDMEAMAARLEKADGTKADRAGTLTPQKNGIDRRPVAVSPSSSSADQSRAGTPAISAASPQPSRLSRSEGEQAASHPTSPALPARDHGPPSIANPMMPDENDQYDDLLDGISFSNGLRDTSFTSTLSMGPAPSKGSKRNYFGSSPAKDNNFSTDQKSKRSHADQAKGWLAPKEGPLTKRFKPNGHQADDGEVPICAAPITPVVNHKAAPLDFDTLADESTDATQKPDDSLEDVVRGASQFDDLRSSDLLDDQPSPTVKASSPETWQHIKLGADSDLRPNKIRRVAFEDETSSRTLATSSTLNLPQGIGESSTIIFPSSPTQAVHDDHVNSGTEPSNSAPSIKLSGHTSSQESLRSNRLFFFEQSPPSKRFLVDTIEDVPLPQKIYQDPFYSVPRDVPKKHREYAGREFKIYGSTLRWLPEFIHAVPRYSSLQSAPHHSSSFGARRWEFARSPPRFAELASLDSSIGSKQAARKAANAPIFAADRHKAARSQIEVSATQANPYGFKFTQMKATTKHIQTKEHMTVFCIELQVGNRPGKVPDPKEDAIQALFYCLQTEDEDIPKTAGAKQDCLVGCIMVDDQSSDDRSTLRRLGLSRYAIEYVPDELELINTLVDKVREWDPEVLSGYEIQNSSWGYLLERAQAEYDLHLVSELSRVIEQSTGRNEKSDRWNFTKSSTIKITGRHTLPIWRLLKGEINLTSYSFENTVFHVLRRRTPHYPAASLNEWMEQGNISQKAFVCRYWLARVEMDVELLDESEIISHTTEFARIYGVDFQSVLNRGSQFKVESVMFRIAKPESYLLLSPTREEVARQNALEAYPLIQEPKSAFYKGPLAVLDFQSLYPSCMIAYNYCYSTCLGRVGTFKGTHKFGVINHVLPDGLLSLLRDHLIISPNGFLFVKHQVRRSLLAKMLSELLDTRVMVKASMKLIKNDKALTRVYNARQLGLKLLANVTYGYTSATFSGRMPCAEIADAIVQTGRETLEKARNLIESHDGWGARCVYGDTDSLFVHLPGKLKPDAFRVSIDMVEAVTALSPRPVKLKLEKIYLPCVLASKKRYVGFKYEAPSELEPGFDAKGIETVRRDGFPAMQKMVEACIKIFFRTQDLSEVKAYCERQWTNILVGAVSPQDFIFAKEVKLGSYSENGIPPPGAVIAARKQEEDARDEAQYGERVAYIIPEPGDGGTRLVDRALTPQEFVLGNRGHRLHAEYYIVHTIKALNRVFTLVGVDVQDWYKEMPKTKRVSKHKESNILTQVPGDKVSKKKTMDAFWHSNHCVACKRPLDKLEVGICEDCQTNSSLASYQMLSKTHLAVKRAADLQRVCASCGHHSVHQTTECDSAECPVFYARAAANAEVVETSQNPLEVAKIWKRNNVQEKTVKIEEIL